MAKPPSEGINLPEPSHPFARWSGRAAIGIWAVIVQSFPEPWNKLGAFLAPGVGYILGQTLQRSIDIFDNMSSTRKQQIDLENAAKKLDHLYNERNIARENGANSDVILLIEQSITAAHQAKISIISPSVKGGGRKSTRL